MLAQAKFQLYSLEQATRGIGLCVDEDLTEFMCFYQMAPFPYDRPLMHTSVAISHQLKAISANTMGRYGLLLTDC